MTDMIGWFMAIGLGTVLLGGFALIGPSSLTALVIAVVVTYLFILTLADHIVRGA